MPSLIDDESEAADLIFVRGNEKAALLSTRTAFAAQRGDDLDEPFSVLGCDRGNDNPVRGMITLEFVYALMGVLWFGIAIVNLRDRRYTNAAFWGLWAEVFLFGSYQPPLVSGIIVIAMVAVMTAGKLAGAPPEGPGVWGGSGGGAGFGAGAAGGSRGSRSYRPSAPVPSSSSS